MKKIVFLILSVMVILFSGCAGSSHGLFRTAGTGKALINTNTPAPLKIDEHRGVCLPISTRSSLGINVECIFDYAQGESTLGPKDEQRDVMNPWINWIFSF